MPLMAGSKHLLPKHFSVVSAQRGPVHDERAHRALESDIRSAGLRAKPVEGWWGGQREKSWMVEHSGTPAQRSLVDALGQKHGQEAVLHSSRVKGPSGKGTVHANQLRFLDGRPPVQGMGHFQSTGAIRGDHSKVDGVSFRLNLAPPEEHEAEQEQAAAQEEEEGSKESDDEGSEDMGKAEGDRPAVSINPEHGRKIADAYEGMKHDPTNPEVKRAYGALIHETGQQFKDLMHGGLKLSRIQHGQANPYKNSAEMHHDIKNNKHLWYFPTEHGFGGANEAKDHPMLTHSGFRHEGKPLLANDVFRIVHDVNGHHKGGESGFGPKGEHQAYLTHKKMYSPLANKALFTETAGQNNWVNFSKEHGEHNRKDPSKTVYAEQKAGLMPDHIVNGKWHEA